MSIKRLSGAGLTTPKSNKLWDQTTFQSGMFALATITLTSSQSSIVFSNIPNGYAHLQVRAMHRHTGTGWQGFVGQRINGDSSALYSAHQIVGQGSGTPNAVGVASQTGIFYGNTSFFYNSFGSGALANAFGVSIYDYLDYANTSKNKTMRGLEGHEGNSGDGNSRCLFVSASWQSTSAITSLSFATWDENNNPTSFAAGTTFALYGIKSA
jgi:hypothetical protein